MSRTRKIEKKISNLNYPFLKKLNDFDKKIVDNLLLQINERTKTKTETSKLMIKYDQNGG